MNECTYDLKQFYAQEFNLTDSERKVYRWGGHVTNILKFRVPATTATGVTNKFEILVEPEVDFKYIEVYLSHGKSVKSHAFKSSIFTNDFFPAQLWMESLA